ncbi:UPF0481 protein [Quillaja saponaria]|uniref:UPF0481 protein n=1 Tax=Quillaja saponaria TaxID=32244 RepID=A0AAD7M3M2_QUISA|nr:UPF0481 protein [Quillaja saponaria]
MEDIPKWVIEVSSKVRNIAHTSMELENWKKHSIYKLPARVIEINKKAYMPQAVSFGPYHHGKDHLKAMEEHKERVLLHFLKRCGKPLELIVQVLGQMVKDLRDSYDALDPLWKVDTPGFLQLMILDGCFMLEILRTVTDHFLEHSDYATNDPIFSNHGKLHFMPYIRRDMLMLENQLPMLVLDTLLAVEQPNKGQENEELINKLILKFCSPGAATIPRMGKCLHVLDVYRKNIVLEEAPMYRSKGIRRRSTRSVGVGDEIIRSAIELYEAGILFEKSESSSLRDISFTGGVLRLPVVVVDDATESTFLNLIAFERFHVGAGNEVTSYIFFMDNLIDREMDVALLETRGIIENALGSDKAVAKLFNSLSKDITLDPERELSVVHMKVSEYCRKPWNKWRANLIQTYFRNPWAILSLIAAFFLFALTILQTVYSVRQYYQPGSAEPMPVPRPRLPRN